MFFVETNGLAPFAKGKWMTNDTLTNNLSHALNITKESLAAIGQSSLVTERVDRHLASRVPWMKLNYNFNNQLKF